jgi:hypothetical protein
MELYAVVKQSKYDYDFSVDTTKHGIFVNKVEAINKAKVVFEKLKEECAENIEKYTYNEDNILDESEEIEFEIDEENGYFEMSFGYEEDHESHCVTVETFKLSDTDVFQIYRKQQKDSLIEDIKGRAEEMELNLSAIDFNRVAHRAEKSIDNNDGLWESYWLSIEYALEKEKEV